ncbi:O-methyltransferase [Geodermatophilus sp. CPCC 205506]|uniref:O-methyltransferase n=1 Tax=Geodermatophilus sp. CPCC 205506 TaxID=2936596 RepID=UPI003EEF6279
MGAAVKQVRKRSGTFAGCALVAGAACMLGSPVRPVPRWVLWSAAGLGTAITANELSGKPVPFLRWSFLRMVMRSKHLATEWQVGDGREAALADHVETHARPGDVDDVIRVVDGFCRHYSFLINVGDEKGAILDDAVHRLQPRRLLELGTYCGYSALRMARAMPADAHVYSIEFNPANAEIARRVLAHAGVAHRVTVVVGTLGDGGETLRRLRDEHGFRAGSLDLVFLDHAKDAYLPDLQRILDEGWLHPGSVVVADNIRFPGVPAFHSYMRDHEDTLWRTTEHRAHVEYQSLLRDVVLESTYLGHSA